MLICFSVLMTLPSQSQKISLDRGQLIELTKKAEKAKLCEGETSALLMENFNLKEKLKTSQNREKELNQRAEQFRKERNRYRFIVWGVGLGVLGIVAVWVIKSKRNGHQ